MTGTSFHHLHYYVENPIPMKIQIPFFSLIFTLILVSVSGLAGTQAQYSMDALRLSKQLPGQDAHTIALGSSSVSQLQGFGSYLNNPAVAAQMPGSSFSIGLGVRNIEQQSTYLGEQTTFDDGQTGITHIGFSYKVPTVVGSLVFGGGYVQSADYNSAFTIDAHNDFTSRTYQFLTDYTSDIAFNTFAIDDFNNELESVFEFGGFQGVDQFAETTRRGQAGEYSFFMATEFQEDFFLGLSVGIPVSRSEFEQVFIEDTPRDRAGQKVYTGEENSGTYNIDRVFFEEKVNVDGVGLNARLGLLYTGLEFLDIGGSYTTATRWNVEETFDAFVQTRFQDVVTLDGEVIVDNDGNTFGPELSDELNGEFSYSVTTPARIKAGAATKGLPIADLSFSAERVNFSSIRLRDFDSAERETQIEENNFINDNFREVWNFSAGATITAIEGVQPRLGWSMQRNPVAYIEENDRHYISAGLGIGVNQGMSIDIGLQYGFWETTEDLYYVDAETGIIVDDFGAPVTFIETAGQETDRFHATVGINFRF